MIPDETVERVREAADIVEIIGEYVKLKRAGGDYRGPCPFHGGKNPNFSVSPKRNAYHCFKCGESGDVISFVRKHLGVDFVDAVKIIGEKSGIVVEEVFTRRTEETDPRDVLYEANAAAMELFQRTLWESDDAAAARAYLESRGIGREVADRFRLGYAPRGTVQQDRLTAQGLELETLVTAGILVRRDADAPAARGAEVYPRFRDRLMIPILDGRERCIAFGGRIMEENERAAKYLNSPETPVFRKGENLYHLNVAKNAIRKAEFALVVEGYFDVVSVAEAGVENVVAGLGTALTADQAALLARLTRQVFLLYDSDEAGQKATFRAAHELLRLGAAVRVVSLPEGEDPDTFVRRHGAAGLQQQLDASLDVFERQVQILERKGWLADLHRKRRAIDRLLPTIRATSDAVTKELYIARLADAAGVSREIIAGEAAIEPSPRGRRAPSGSHEVVVREDRNEGSPRSHDEDTSWPRPVMPRPGDRRGGERRKGYKSAPEWLAAPGVGRGAPNEGTAAERALCLVMLANRPSVEVVAERYGPESFRDVRYRAIFEMLLGADPSAGSQEMAEALPDVAGPEFGKLVEEAQEDLNLQRMMQDALDQLRSREISEQIDTLQETVPLADDAEKDVLLRRIKELQLEKLALGRRGTWGGFKRTGNR